MAEVKDKAIYKIPKPLLPVMETYWKCIAKQGIINSCFSYLANKIKNYLSDGSYLEQNRLY